MKIPEILKEIASKIFDEKDELEIDEFKQKSSLIRIGGKNWLPLGKDLEEVGLINIKGKKIRLIK